MKVLNDVFLDKAYKVNHVKIVNDTEAINETDIIVYLVAHKEFEGIRVFGKKVFDFCDVTNH